jgi:hypothetical protein
VPRAGRLVGGVVAHSAGRPKIATGAPLLGHGRASRPLLVGGNKTYRKGKWEANNKSASDAGRATGAPRLAHVRSDGGGLMFGPRLGLGPHRPESWPEAARPGAGRA